MLHQHSEAASAARTSNGYDAILVGAGLAGSLIALRLASKRPDLSILMVDRRPALAGDHTWSFHETDLTDEATAWMAPLVAKTWERQSIAFPRRRRSLRTGYRSITSASMRAALEAAPNIFARTGDDVSVLADDHVAFADGESVPAPLVIDARGAEAMGEHFVLAWQKFLGLIVEVEGGHGETEPTIMDATVPQLDGFRFVYLLPQDDTRILIEDTRYSDGSALDKDAMREEIHAYARAKGWTVKAVDHEESGVLPIALAHDAERMWNAMPRNAVPVGMRAGLFHAITGYSLPLAVRVADMIAHAPELTTSAVFPRIEAYARGEAKRQWFFRFLNRMLFRGSPPDHRWFIMQRFYGLREGLIERFYADRLRWYDKLRIVSGKPPIPIHRGLRCMPETPLLKELR